ncbi:MAG TPA: hypothetical protein VGG14_16635 [Candidatus Sulfotelmatobacter sp.]
MGNIFDQVNPGTASTAAPDQPVQPVQPAQSTQPTTSGTPTQQPTTGNIFEQVNPSTSSDTAATTNQPPASTSSVAKHGLLQRAWDWVNEPLFDNVLPQGIKTSDIVKAAAFEKMYNEAYIPGVNDFDTKARDHFEAPAKAVVGTKDGHPYVAAPESHAVKNAIRTFIAGVGKDTSDMAAGFTSPVGIATTLAGVGPEAKAGTVLAKVAPVAKALAGTAFGLKGAHDIYEAGTENTSEAWQQRLQGAAMATGGAAALAEPISAGVSKVSPTVRGAAETVENIRKGGQPKLQPAIRTAGQSAADVANVRPEITLEDKYPVSVTHDESGNITSVDGRHRVLAALERGDETIPVKTTLADGTTETLPQTPQAVAAKMGLGKTLQEVRDSIAATDEQQGAVRAGDGQPRKPALQAVETPTTPTEGPASTASMRNALQDVADDIESKGKKIYAQLDKASGGRFQRYTDSLDKIHDRLGNLVEGVDDDEIERLEQKKNEIETSQAQMFDDLKGDGVNSDLAKAANAHWRQAQALKDVQRAIGTSTKGNSLYGEKEIVNPSQLVTKLEKLNARPNKGVPSRLEQALGPEGADTLMKEGYAAVKAKRLQTAAKWSAGISSLVFGGSGYLHHLLTAAVLP